MEYRQLGRSGLRVSTLTLGTMTFGGKGGFGAVGSTDVEGARRQIDMALDAGVNLIDTADVYSQGTAEEMVGEAIKGKRDELLLSTKVRMPMGDGPNDAGLSRHHILSGVEASLRRLGTDHIDIYHVHEWDGQTPARGDPVRARLTGAVGQGALPGGVELLGLAAHEGAGGGGRPGLSSGSSPSRSTTPWRRGTPSTS